MTEIEKGITAKLGAPGNGSKKFTMAKLFGAALALLTFACIVGLGLGALKGAQAEALSSLGTIGAICAASLGLLVTGYCLSQAALDAILTNAAAAIRSLPPGGSG